MLLRINPDNISASEIEKAVNVLRDGGIIIYPTDTVYGIGCDIDKQRAVERICRLKGIDPEKANLSFICYDLSHISDYTKQIDNNIYKVMRRALPGPFTFILEANNNVPKLFRNKKKTVGIRVPDNEIVREIVRVLGNPILSTSVHDEDEIIDYTTDPEVIYERFKDKVNLVIAGGYSNNQPSTVVDCTGDEFVVLRQGLGDIEEYL